ncbi:MAG: alpha-amylase [Cryomorphaceae bacterium]|nr:alpha-amylase [Cryomorphaceae bacterium]
MSIKYILTLSIPTLFSMNILTSSGQVLDKTSVDTNSTVFNDNFRVDPPYWWTGMDSQDVELLIYKEGVGESTISLNSTGASIIRAERAMNKNYMFITLRISREAKAGELNFRVTDKSGAEQSLKYTLREKSEMAFGRQGLTSSDFIYLLMPDRFSNGNLSNDNVLGMHDQSLNRKEMFDRHGGDLAGMTAHLDYLEELGVTAIWPNPVWENDEPKASYHGYAPTDIYRIDRRLGDAADYAEFVEQSHKRGIKVVKDIVYNHWGDQHWIYKDLPDSSWLNVWDDYTRTNYRAVALVDPYAAEYDKKQMTDGWFDRHMPDLNQRNPHLANYLIQHSIWWAGHYGIDSYRIDTYAYPDQLFMKELAERLHSEFPTLFLFGETWVHGTPVQAWFTESNGTLKSYNSDLESVTDFQLYYAINKALTEEGGWTEGMARIYYTLAKDILYQQPDLLVTFLDNHDLSRIHSVLGEDRNKVKHALALMMTLRGIPSIYYGTEIGMKNFADPDGKVREDFPGGWDGDAADKFTRAGRSEEENDLFDYIKTLANYRKQHPALFEGKFMQFVPTDNHYTYFRYTDGKRLMVSINYSGKTKDIDLERFEEILRGSTKARDILTGSIVDLTTTTIADKQMMIFEILAD